jgi:hypothetical protein
MAAKTVTITLTLAEARALSRAAGNTTIGPDAMEAIFPTGAERHAAYRAQEKLDTAIARRGGWSAVAKVKEA